MRERILVFGSIVIFFAGILMLYTIYLIGKPFVWLAHGQPGVELWKEQFSLE